MAPQFIRHAWQAAQADKARAFRDQLARLTLKLSDILRAAFVHSEAGRKPDSLKRPSAPHTATSSTSG